MAPARGLTPVRLAGAGFFAAVAGWTALNRAVVHRLTGDAEGAGVLEPAMPDGAREAVMVMSDGWEIRVVERGPPDGPAVVLLHGITLSAEVWSYQLAGLADSGMRVVAVDLRGHGRSASPPGGAPAITFDRMAADVEEVIDRLGLGRVTLVGHSMGGMVALRMMALDPSLASGSGPVSALMLVATTAHPTHGRGVPGLNQVVAAGHPIMSSAAGLAARLPGPTLPANDLAFLLARVTFGDRSRPGQVRFTGRLTSAVPVRVSAQLMLEILRFDAEAALAQVAVPTTVVVGDRDLVTPPPQSRHLARSIPGADLVVLPGCGHMVMLERPADLDRAIAGLVERRR